MSFHRSLDSIHPSPTSHGVGLKRVLLSGNEVCSDITQIARTSLSAGEMSGSHVHESMDEFFMVLSGEVTIFAGENVYHCLKDDSVFVPVGTGHCLRADTDCEVLTVGCAVRVAGNVVE